MKRFPKLFPAQLLFTYQHITCDYTSQLAQGKTVGLQKSPYILLQKTKQDKTKIKDLKYLLVLRDKGVSYLTSCPGAQIGGMPWFDNICIGRCFFLVLMIESFPQVSFTNCGSSLKRVFY